MPQISFKLDFERVATIKTGKGEVKVGDVTEFKQNPDGTLEMVIEFYPLLPKKVQEQIEKTPQMLSIQSKPKSASNVLIIDDEK